MKRKAVSIRVLVTLLLGLAAGLTVLAAAPPFPINWQGVKAPIPQGGHWFAEASVDGKIYLFGGLASSESESSITLNNTQIYDPATDTWTAGAAMPTGRYLATAAAVGGKIYVMGGRTITSAGAGGPVNANEAYDPATNTWAVMASMPSAVRGHAATVYDNKIYVFGGNTGTYQKTVRIYDPSTNGWSTAANMPQVRAYGAAVYVPSKGRIYYIGGDNGGSTATKYYGTAITFDPSANTWDSGTIDMSDKVSSFGCAFDPSAGDIYVFSGTMWDQANNRDQASSYKVQVLDTATNTFSDSENLPPSPQNRSDCSADCVDGVVYLMGGTVSDKLVDALDVATGDWFGNIAPSPVSADNPNAFNVGGKLYLLNGVSSSLNTAVFSYDPNTGAWTQSGAFNSAPRYAAVADVSDGKIVIADGQNMGGVVAAAELYDPAADAFTSLASDPTPYPYACGAAVNGKLYVFGGFDSSSQVGVDKGRVLDIAGNSWGTTANMPVGLYGATAAAFNGKIYIFGGFDGGSSSTTNATVYIYDPAADSFTTGPSMPVGVYFSASTVFGNYILVYGGDNLYFQATTRYYRPAGFLQVYDPAAGMFTSTMGLYTRWNHQIAVINNSLYAVGGDDNDYLESRLDVAQLYSGPPALAVTASADKTTGPPPLTVNFSGGATGGTAPYTYDWDFGDGTAHAATQNASHTYTDAGTYAAKLTVHDAASASASKTLTITVNSSALGASASADKTSGPVPLQVQFTGDASGGTSPYTYSWDFGDGTAASTDQSPSHTYGSVGSYTARLTVHDAASGTATAEVAITVTDVAPPVISSMQKRGSPFRIVVIGSNLQSNMQVLINGTLWSTVKYKDTTKIVLKGGKSLKTLVPKNTLTHFTFMNPDGGVVEQDWQWP